jgi:hypothetical protein
MGSDTSPIVMLFEGAGQNGADRTQAVMPSTIGVADEPALVRALADAVTRGGRLVELSAMPVSERQRAEALLDSILRLRAPDPRLGLTGPVTVQSLWLVSNTSVSAKAL